MTGKQAFWLRIIATTILPPLGLYLYSHLYHPDLLRDVPDDVNAKNFVLPVGYETDEKTGEERVKVVKFPKGDADQLFWNPMEKLLEVAFKSEPLRAVKFALEYLSDNTPIEFMNKGKIDLARMASGMALPVLKAGVEQAANKNLYFGSPIVPEKLSGLAPELQTTPRTPAAAIAIGNALGISPIRVQAFVRSAFGPIPGAAAPGDVLKSTASRFVTTVPKATKGDVFDIHRDVETGYLSTRELMRRAIKGNNFSELGRLAREWNKKVIGYAPELAKLTGESEGAILSSPYFKSKYTFQAKDLKAMLKEVLLGETPTSAADILGMVPKEKK